MTVTGYPTESRQALADGTYTDWSRRDALSAGEIYQMYVCLDRGSTHRQQTPCDNYREDEVIPTFILHPNTVDNPDDFTDNFVGIPARP